MIGSSCLLELGANLFAGVVGGIIAGAIVSIFLKIQKRIKDKQKKKEQINGVSKLIVNLQSQFLEALKEYGQETELAHEQIFAHYNWIRDEIESYVREECHQLSYLEKGEITGCFNTQYMAQPIHPEIYKRNILELSNIEWLTF